LGLNSQALLEAAFEGFQPIQFANAFYGNRGFTSDYNLDELEQFVTDLNNKKIPSKLGLEQYRSYEEFITKALQFSLVSAFPSGKSMLKTIFHITPPISLVGKTIANQPTPKNITSPKLVKTDTLNTPPGFETNLTTQSLPENNSQKQRGKKINKFLKTPKKFFLDSKNPRVRWLHIFFPKTTKISK
jgi:hypothetical protein